MLARRRFRHRGWIQHDLGKEKSDIINRRCDAGRAGIAGRNPYARISVTLLTITEPPIIAADYCRLSTQRKLESYGRFLRIEAV
jgi:hypothetical protein